MWPYLKDASTAVIAFAGLWIAWEQKRIADTRLRSDLYDRRLRTYETAKTLLVSFQYEGKLTTPDYITYKRGTADAEFLFSDNPNVLRYLDLLGKQTVELIKLQQQEAASADKYAAVETWFASQFDVLRSSFQPSMRLAPSPLIQRLKGWF